MQVNDDFLKELERITKRIWMVEAALDVNDPEQKILRRQLYEARHSVGFAEHFAKVKLGMREA